MGGAVTLCSFKHARRNPPHRLRWGNYIVLLTLREKRHEIADVWSFVFDPPEPLAWENSVQGLTITIPPSLLGGGTPEDPGLPGDHAYTLKMVPVPQLL